MTLYIFSIDLAELNEIINRNHPLFKKNSTKLNQLTINEKYPEFIFTQKSLIAHQNTCSICLSDFRKRSTMRKLKCDHIFHKRCIDKWLHTSINCPTCRIALN
jgi:E3 ubiquitin-protein ligase RHA2